VTTRPPRAGKRPAAEAVFVAWVLLVTILYYRQWLPQIGAFLRHLGF
jgi:hypothetical protein